MKASCWRSSTRPPNGARGPSPRCAGPQERATSTDWLTKVTWTSRAPTRKPAAFTIAIISPVWVRHDRFALIFTNLLLLLKYYFSLWLVCIFFKQLLVVPVNVIIHSVLLCSYFYSGMLLYYGCNIVDRFCFVFQRNSCKWHVFFLKHDFSVNLCLSFLKTYKGNYCSYDPNT